MRNEAGGHRVQRVPPTERRGRVHTSTVTVAFLEAQGSRQVAEDGDDFVVEWFSGSGAGGQHRNKHANSCRIKHLPTGLVRSAQTRSRENSYRLARQGLDEALRVMSEQQHHGRENQVRKAQVGSGMRGDKRRTYRFQDDHVVDHLTGRRAKATRVMAGDISLMW